eukprot:CAMPEP_0196130874 /NCGR_PEP_ID=MMETSP0910-20130528/1097_1 /TAXON_ID=49265 /ORGANISM="Thalassiosira rotula, Strain GSO102" /LENGTH=379 /DNA_ID=CAMNT_0041390257 /DNA_START=107 /DNA_END=1246 /DNA_ORIENTATION=+
MKARRPSCTILLAASAAVVASAFQLPCHRRRVSPSLPSSPSFQRVRILEMAAGDNKVSKRRRRKRKKADGAPSTPPATAAATTPPTTPILSAADEEKKRSAAATAAQLLAQESMMYDEDDLTSFTPQKLEEDDRIAAAAAKAGYSVDPTTPGTELEDLFDSREFLQRKREKQMEDAATAGKPSSVIPTKKKIKRSDVKAYERLLEMDPLADEDDSYFEDEGIDFISALLGDVEPGVGDDSDENVNKSGNKVQKKTSFLGIGSGPLQVGHFIGALGVILMAFVEYPGFPLTNLPPPLRGALQGGLGTIYLINIVLAVLAAISAPSRNQSSLLWGAKTFAVGAIAYDQLMAIPTPEELVERARKEEEMTKRRSGRRGGRGR